MYCEGWVLKVVGEVAKFAVFLKVLVRCVVMCGVSWGGCLLWERVVVRGK